jgi:hypothetical protein
MVLGENLAAQKKGVDAKKGTGKAGKGSGKGSA